MKKIKSFSASYGGAIVLLSMALTYSCKKMANLDQQKNLSFSKTFNSLSSFGYFHRVGDAGINFDLPASDPTGDIAKWATAGVENGIPFVTWNRTMSPTTSGHQTNSADINAAIAQVATAGGGRIDFASGTYNIDATINMKSNVSLQGLTGAIFNITLRDPNSLPDDYTYHVKSAIEFNGTQNAGIHLIAIQYDGGGLIPDPADMANDHPTFLINSVAFLKLAKNCWVDNCSILNSGNHPIFCDSVSHITIRSCDINGSFNKGGAGRGYVMIHNNSNYVLLYDNKVQKIRHVSLQDGAKYCVLYKNIFQQDINFHNADGGHNLIEKNDVTIPTWLDVKYHAFLTPWASFHQLYSGAINDVEYDNHGYEVNYPSRSSLNDPNLVYTPKLNQDNDDATDNEFITTYATVPAAKTFYPAHDISYNITNGDFETDAVGTLVPTGWVAWGTANSGKVEAGGHFGFKRLAYYNPGPYSISSTQAIANTPNGLYTLKAWVRSSGGQNNMVMFAKDYGAAELDYTFNTSISVWTQIVIPNIPISNGQCSIGFYCNAPAGKWCQIDDIEFYKQAP